MATLFMIHDESGLGEAEREAAEYASLPGNSGLPPKTWAQVQEISEQGERLGINGRIFGNLAGLEMIEGERVRWYVFGLGSENDFHTAHWHGVKVIEEARRRTDVIELLPASMKVADMVADNPGSWLLHCHVSAHMAEGMFAQFIIHPRGSIGARPGLVEPFFGLRRSQSSLQIKLAEVVMDKPLATATSCEVTIEGAVTVFQAFSVFTQPVTVQIGQANAAFKPNRQSVAEIANGRLRIKNANQYGVVYGGMMEFEARVKGADWLAEIRRVVQPKDGGEAPTEVELPLVIKVGLATHKATAKVTIRTK
jgi:hypothetical protein